MTDWNLIEFPLAEAVLVLHREESQWARGLKERSVGVVHAAARVARIDSFRVSKGIPGING